MQPRILVDMDEVLVDFVGGACRAHGSTRAAAERHWTPGRWDLVPPLSAALGLDKPMTPEQFWSLLNGNEDFWLGLEPYPWLEEVLNLVKEYTDDWHIITAPSRCDSSYSGKVRWLKRYFGADFMDFCITPHKHLFAMPGVVLIDDRNENCANFLARTTVGGRRPTGAAAVVFPRLHNRLHAWMDDPLAYLRHALPHRIRETMDVLE